MKKQKTRWKPPLGLRPKRIVDALRREEILEAIKRYIVAGYPIPEIWISELAALKNK